MTGTTPVSILSTVALTTDKTESSTNVLAGPGYSIRQPGQLVSIANTGVRGSSRPSYLIVDVAFAAGNPPCANQ